MKSRWTWTIVLAAFVTGCSNMDETTAPAVYQPADDIYQAAADGDLQAVQQFIVAGDWDYNLINHQGMTPLHAAVKGGNVDIVVLMAQQGAFIEITDTSGRTPLKYAQELGQEEVAQALQQLGATQ